MKIRATLLLLTITLTLTACGGEILDPSPDGSISNPPAVIEPPENTYCGDTICDSGWEDFLLCPEDCLPYCGDGICSLSAGETILSCYRDCKPRLATHNLPEHPANQITDPPGDRPCPITDLDRFLPRYK